MTLLVAHEKQDKPVDANCVVILLVGPQIPDFPRPGQCGRALKGTALQSFLRLFLPQIGISRFVRKYFDPPNAGSTRYNKALPAHAPEGLPSDFLTPRHVKFARTFVLKLSNLLIFLRRSHKQ